MYHPLNNYPTVLGQRKQTLYIPISLEVHLEPTVCTVYKENYHPGPSSWQVGRVCSKMQGHVASSLVSHMQLSQIWPEASCWTLLRMPTRQTSLSRTMLTSWVHDQRAEKSRKKKIITYWSQAYNISTRHGVMRGIYKGHILSIKCWHNGKFCSSNYGLPLPKQIKMS